MPEHILKGIPLIDPALLVVDKATVKVEDLIWKRPLRAAVDPSQAGCEIVNASGIDFTWKCCRAPSRMNCSQSR